ncbi:MAG: TlpA disulfide reductase family protein [Candidatus Zixiibacteriota bacterium]
MNRTGMNSRIVLVFSAAVALYCALSCGSSKEASTPKSQELTPATSTTGAGSQQAIVGVPFEAVDANGANHQSTEWLGKKPVVLNFWGTWCPPCRREMPELIRLYKEYEPKGIEMIGFAVKDRPFDVQQFANANDMRWVMLMANDDIINNYDVVNGIPTTIFIDKNGKEITRFVGARGYDDFKPAFEAILK